MDTSRLPYSLKDSTMKTANYTEACKHLEDIRQQAFEAIARDLQTAMQILQPLAANEVQEIPEGAGLSPWMRHAFEASILPDGGVSWSAARAVLAAHTALRIASTQAPGGVPGHQLAEETGIDLFAFAGECWASLTGEQGPMKVERPQCAV